MTEAKTRRRRKVPEDAFDVLTAEWAEHLYSVKAERLVELARAGKIEGKRYHGLDWYIAPHQDVPERYTRGFETEYLQAFGKKYPL